MIQNYILIIGAMKSGTTTLFDLLSQHPQIAPCTPKEPGFFAFEDRWAEGFEWYESLFDFDPAQHVYALDGSTDYTKNPFCTGVTERLAQSAPRRFKLIYVMRHPLRRIESHARHVQRTQREVGQLTSVRADHCLSAGISPVSLAVSRYSHQIDRYHAYLDTGDLMLLSFEDLITNQAAILAKIFDFLSLDPVGIEPIHSNRNREIRQAPAFWPLLNRLGPISYLVKRVVPRRLRRQLKKALSQKTEITGRFTLTSEEEKAALEILKSDLDRLRVTYGINTGQLWNMPDTKPFEDSGNAR